MAGLRYTRELLEETARETSSWDEAVRGCGGEPTRHSKRYLRDKMLAIGIDVSRIATRAVRHTETALREAVAQSSSISDVVRRLGVSNVGGNHTHISRRIAALGIDISHFVSKHGKGPGARGDVLVLRDTDTGRVPGPRLRRALLENGVRNACALCAACTWTGQAIPLEVDHVNGDWRDNRPENLRLLCPNCHAVTDTYRGRKQAAK